MFLTKAFVLASVVAKVQPSDEALVVEAVNLTTRATCYVELKTEHNEQIEHIGKCVRKDHDTFTHIMTYYVFVEVFMWAGEGI